MDVLHRLKYRRDLSAGVTLSHLFRRLAVSPLNYDVVIPVPLHSIRLRWRCFNQAVNLMHDIVERGGRERLLPLALARQRATASQVELGESARRENVRGAIKVTQPDRVEGATVLLVDDVMTTGATADSCAAALRRAGALHIDVLVLLRAVR